MERKNKHNKIEKYFVFDVADLPSKNRLGINARYSYVRGYYLDELFAISNYEEDVGALIKILSDVVYVEDNDTKENIFHELEFVDYQYLLIAASIATYKDHTWSLSFSCPCGKKHKRDVKIDDIEYDVPTVGVEKIGGFEVRPLTVKSFLKPEKKPKNVDADFWEVAKMYFVDFDDDGIATIMSDFDLSKTIIDFKKAQEVKIKDIEHMCDKCENITKIPISINNIMVYL